MQPHHYLKQTCPLLMSLSQPWWSLLSVSMDLPVLDISNKQNQTIGSLWALMYRFRCRHMLSILHLYLGMELPDHMGMLRSTCQVAASFLSPTCNVWGSLFPHNLFNICIACFILEITMRVKRASWLAFPYDQCVATVHPLRPHSRSCHWQCLPLILCTFLPSPAPRSP